MPECPPKCSAQDYARTFLQDTLPISATHWPPTPLVPPTPPATPRSLAGSSQPSHLWSPSCWFRWARAPQNPWVPAPKPGRTRPGRTAPSQVALRPSSWTLSAAPQPAASHVGHPGEHRPTPRWALRCADQSARHAGQHLLQAISRQQHETSPEAPPRLGMERYEAPLRSRRHFVIIIWKANVEYYLKPPVPTSHQFHHSYHYIRIIAPEGGLKKKWIGLFRKYSGLA